MKAKRLEEVGSTVCEDAGAGMRDVGFEEGLKRILFTKAYATIERLYRHDGRFYVGRDEWWSDDDEKRIPFFDRTGDSNPEEFEELTEAEASEWLSERRRCGTDLESLADEIAKVDQMEAKVEQERLARLFGEETLFGERTTPPEPEQASPVALKPNGTGGCGCCLAVEDGTCCGRRCQ